MSETGTPGDPGFVLLCGCPRSGTTLLAQHLGRALGLAMPVETHFVPHFRRYLALWGDLARPGNQRNLIEAIEAYTRVWVYRGIRSSNPKGFADISLLPVLEKAQPVTGGFADLLDSIYRQYAARYRMPHYGDKSAPFEPENLALYDASTRRLRVVHIVRDGRDVHLSWSAVWFGPRSVAETAWIWRRHIERRRAWGRRNPGRYLEVRYEDFIADPPAVLDRIAAFLGVERQATPPDDPLGQVIGQEAAHVKLAERIDPANARKWQAAMAPGDQALFAFIAGEALAACGYVAGAQAGGGKARAVMWLRYAAGIVGHCLSPTWFLRRGRALMPPFLRAMQLAGIARWITRSVSATSAAVR